MAMLLFSIASSSLLLINKLCVTHMPVPAFISMVQFACASVTSMVLMATGSVATDRWEWYKIKPYLVYAVMFVCTIYANMRALQHSNVETIIVFRSACPLIVCILDWAFLGRQLPSLRSICALLVVLGGALGYSLVGARARDQKTLSKSERGSSSGSSRPSRQSRNTSTTRRRPTTPTPKPTPKPRRSSSRGPSR